MVTFSLSITVPSKYGVIDPEDTTDWEMRVPKPPAPPYTLGVRNWMGALEMRVWPYPTSCIPPPMLYVLALEMLRPL